MKRKKGEAQQLIADALSRLGGERTTGEIAKAATLTRAYAALLLRDLVDSGRVEKVCHGVYRIKRDTPPPAPIVKSGRTLPNAAAPQQREVVQRLQESTANLRELIEHVQAVERILLEFKPGNAQAQIEIYLAAKHLLRAVDWITGVVRPELPRPMGEESSGEVNRALSSR